MPGPGAPSLAVCVLPGPAAPPRPAAAQSKLGSRSQPSLPARPRRCRRAATAAAAASDAGQPDAADFEEAVAAEAHSYTSQWASSAHTSAAEAAAAGLSEHAFAAAESHTFAGPASLLGGPPAATPFGPAEPLGGAGGSGWVWAAAVLLAARMGRVAAQEARLDVRQLQFERERSRALSKELLAARERWRATEEERAAAEDARRVEEAAAKARAELQRAKEEQRRYQEAASKEAERLRQEREAQRKEYEEAQARMDAEIRAREEQERLVIEQQRAAARAAEEARRREEEERRRRLEEERRQREEEEQRQREEAIRAKLEERRRLEREKKKFGLRLEGSLAVERPPKGTLLPGPLQKEASVRLAASVTSLLGGTATATPADFASLTDASEALPRVLGEACRAAGDAYASAMRLQSMAGEGVLQWIDDTELAAWAQATAMRAAVAGLAAGDGALQRFQQAGSAASEPSSFQCRTELGVLPADHPQRTEALLRRVIASIESGDSEAASRQLDDLLEVAVEAYRKDLPTCPRLAEPAPAVMATALLLSHLLTRALAERPFAASDAPAWFEATARLVRSKLKDASASAPKDTLQVPAAIIAAVLGANNPVAEELLRLADANLSADARKAQQDRERRLAAELAAKLVEEEWPDAKEIKAARRAEEEAKTPIPERCWALRNVAGTLSMGGPGERARARQLLEQAVLLKQQFAGGKDHPAVLPELMPLAALLAASPEWQRDAGGVAALILSALSAVAASYQRQGDAVSAAILLEAALRRFEEVAGVRHPAVKAAMRSADAALEGLSAEQRSVVAAARPQAEAAVARVVGALTDELGAYQQGSPVTKTQLWDAEGAALIGPLH